MVDTLYSTFITTRNALGQQSIWKKTLGVCLTIVIISAINRPVFLLRFFGGPLKRNQIRYQIIIECLVYCDDVCTVLATKPTAPFQSSLWELRLCVQRETWKKTRTFSVIMLLYRLTG